MEDLRPMQSHQNVFRPSRRIPESLKREVRARDGNRCAICKRNLPPDILEVDHITPVALYGPTILENLQLLCPPCNRKKGSGVPVCPHCKKWNQPNATFCAFCKARLPQFNIRQNSGFTLRRKLLLGVALVCLLFGGLGIAASVVRSVFSRFAASSGTNQIINQSVNIEPMQHSAAPFTVRSGSVNPRVVGGFRVTNGSPIDFYIVDKNQYAQWAGGGQLLSHYGLRQSVANRVRQNLSDGDYYLIFYNGSTSTVSVAAELYLKTD
jgi:HNH endonuclease